ncbi:hypothetical protein SASPL_129760 [Salvia splendens]|uniref:Cationic amino acid transporter C-terminal domain-containing protein n=1 Tax=Salvia splendens TaxID=180675 RepID=A0A8X8XHS7_SALSN|nr:hypothetical protein SASPL_129760 [Salvia splendens]
MRGLLDNSTIGNDGIRRIGADKPDTHTPKNCVRILMRPGLVVVSRVVVQHCQGNQTLDKPKIRVLISPYRANQASPYVFKLNVCPIWVVMEFLSDAQNDNDNDNGNGNCAGGGGGFMSLVRRKQVDSDRPKTTTSRQNLAKSWFDYRGWSVYSCWYYGCFVLLVFLQAFLFGGADSLPMFLARYSILVVVVTGLLCVGIKQVKNPQRDLPMGIGLALSIHVYSNDWRLYRSLFNVDGFNPSTATNTNGNGERRLLPSVFSDVNIKTQVPLKSTVVTSFLAALLAFFMDVEALSGMVSVGTLLAFTMVAISVLILRYIPPDVVPIPSSLQEAVDSVSSKYSEADDADAKAITPEDHVPVLVNKDAPLEDPLLDKVAVQLNYLTSEENRRTLAGWAIACTCVGVVILTSAASTRNLLHSWFQMYVRFPHALISSNEILNKITIIHSNTYRYSLCGVGGVLVMSSLILLTWIDQDDARHSFGQTGGFICPFVPLLPIASILINVYLLINLGGDTWMRVSVWLAIVALVYAFYGRNHSSLQNVVYVPAAHVDEIYDSVSQPHP